MYAIVEIGGKQYRVMKDMKLKVPTLQADPGKSVDFDRVLAFEDDKGDISFGTPLLENTNVSAKIIEHGRDKKIIVFKKKRRKGYQKKNGHRQGYSLIEITYIGSAKKAKAKEVAAAPIADKKATKEKIVKGKKTAKPETKVKPKIEKKAAPQVKAKKVTSVKSTVKAKTTATKKTSSTGVKKDRTESKTSKTKKITPKKDVKED